jgi:hypothetical protein
MERDDNDMPVPGADRTGSDRFKDTSDETKTQSVREANENIREGQGDDATGSPRRGNRPRFDRDR